MKPMSRFVLAGLLTALVGSSAVHAVPAELPGSIAAGQILHAANCTGCHDTSVYTRKARTVHSLDGLAQQLQDCSHVAKKNFSPVETQNLVKFLNDRFYHFQ